MAIIDGDGRYIWVNRKSAENNGMAAADVPGKTLDAVVGAASAKPVLRNIRNVLESGFSEFVTHDVLLRNGVVMIEYLCNTAALEKPRTYLCALPLKIPASDGAPARVIAIEAF